MRIFPKLENIVSKDDLRPVMTNAVIEKGRLIATNGHVMLFSSLESIYEAGGGVLKGFKDLDGVMLGPQTIKYLGATKVKSVDFQGSRLVAYAGKEKRVFYYSGKKLESGSYEQIDEITGDKLESQVNYPNWGVVIPKKSEDVKPFESFGINPTLLKSLTEGFVYSGEAVQVNNTKERYASFVQPLPNYGKTEKGIEGQIAIIMPVAMSSPLNPFNQTSNL